MKQIATTLDDYVYTPDDKMIEGEVEAGKRYARAGFQPHHRDRGARSATASSCSWSRSTRARRRWCSARRRHHALAGARPDQPDEDEQGPELLRAGHGQRRRTLGDQYLRDFQDNEKTIPTILTTSQKLSTGVDARNVRNIVLMRPINSMIEFKQIIGRGTRLFDGKDYFTIYDFVKAYQHFNDPGVGRRAARAGRTERQPRRRPGGDEPSRTTGGRRRRAAARAGEDQDQARRRQGAHHPAHDGDDLLEPGRHAHVGRAVRGEAVR